MTICCLHMLSDLPSPNDKGVDNHEVSPRAIGLDCLWIARLRMTICCLHVSSGLPSLDDKGADNHEVSPLVIRLNCLWIARVQMTICCLRVLSNLLSLNDKGEKVRGQMVPHMLSGPPPLDDKRRKKWK